MINTQTTTRERILFVATSLLTKDVVDWVMHNYGNTDITYLPSGNFDHPFELPEQWQQLKLTDVGTLDELRRDYLAHVESISETAFDGKNSLSQRLKRRDGYSVWWTDCGVRRSPVQGMFVTIKAVWMVRRAVKQIQPHLVLIHAQSPRLAAIAFWSSTDAASVLLTPPTPRLELAEVNLLDKWHEHAVNYTHQFIAHRQKRFDYMSQSCRLPSMPASSSCAVLTGFVPRHIHYDDNGHIQVWYWQSLCESLHHRAPDLSFRYLLDRESSDTWPLESHFSYLDQDNRCTNSDSIIPLWYGHGDKQRWEDVRTHQLQQLSQYRSIEGHAHYRRLFRFEGVDLSPEWINEFRHSLQMGVWWESEVDTTEYLLKQCGNIRLAVVHLEFEPRGMAIIAACRRLGIKTVGVQHGTFYPLQTAYTPPKSQLLQSPHPDYHCVYGEYHQEALSHLGAYPKDRVFVCAGSRFDAKVNQPLDPIESRRKLGLPEDRRIILITTQSYSWFVKAVTIILEHLPSDMIVVIKSYGPDYDMYNQIVSHYRNPRIFLYRDCFEELLAACDVLFSVSSTTVLEATLLSKPTVCINLSNEPFYYPYVEEGVSIPARSEDELVTLLSNMSHHLCDNAWNERRLKFLHRHLGPASQGRASEIFANTLSDLMK